jgi:hypothetical protein
VSFDHIALPDLTFDSQIEVMEDVAITTYSLLESLWARPLIWVIRIVVYIARGIQLIDGRPVRSVPDFIELPTDEHLVIFDRHRPYPLWFLDR